MNNEFLPAGTVYDDLNGRIREEDRAGTRVVCTGLFRVRARSTSPGNNRSVGSSGSHEYCCSKYTRPPG
ncbi:MAG TPA: hypothetical protein VIC86_12425 [Acidimicrobiales bacterium]|jgi:hypothetical protein